MASEQVAQVATAVDQFTPAFIGVAGVVVGAIMVWIKEWATAWQNRRRDAQYLVIRVVCILDEFIDRCVDTAQDDGKLLTGDSVDQKPEFYTDSPQLWAFPDDLNWKSIDTKLAYNLLTLRSEAEFVAKKIDFLTRYADMKWNNPEKRQIEYAQLGLKIFNITAVLREKYKIPDRDGMLSNPDCILQAIITKTQIAQPEREKTMEAIV